MYALFCPCSNAGVMHEFPLAMLALCHRGQAEVEEVSRTQQQAACVLVGEGAGTRSEPSPLWLTQTENCKQQVDEQAGMGQQVFHA